MAKLRTSAGFSGLSGRTGNMVFAQTQYGTILREPPTPPRNRTAAQEQVGRNLRRANAAWRALTQPQIDAWQVYCLSLSAENRETGLPVVPQAPHVFLGLACKILQMDEDAAIPVAPPSQPFYGDSVRCSVQGGSGEILISASAANAAGVTTEFLVQRLRHLNNKPQPRSYTTCGFRAFVSGSLGMSFARRAGTYAVAMRFVDVASGRKTEVYPIGKVVVTP